MKKTLTAALLVAPLALAACGSPEGAPATATTTSAVIEESRGSGGSYSADDQVVPADRTTTSAPTPTIEDLYIKTLDNLDVSYTSRSDVIRSGHVVCQFIDEGHLLSDLFIEMAIDPQVERILPPVSNDDLPYVVGAAVPAFCPEHEAAVSRDLGF